MGTDYGNAGLAASQAWRAMGDHGFGVRRIPGEPPFVKVLVSNEVLISHIMTISIYPLVDHIVWS